MTVKDIVPPALRDIVDRHRTRLTPADGRLLDVLLDDPMRAALENGTLISSRAGVHPASAVRLARRLGFAGYPEFRSFIQASLVDSEGDFESPAARMAARLVRAESTGVLGSILDSEIAALERVRNAIADAEIRSFAECLRGSRRVFVLGRGHSAALAALIALRLNRSGYGAVDLGKEVSQLPEALHQIGPQDVLWLLAFRKVSPLVQEVREVAASRGARTLLLSDNKAMRLDPPANHQIRVSRGTVGESQSLVVPMTIANAIILDLASIDDGHSIRSLEAFKSFRSTSGLHGAASLRQQR